MTVPNISMPQSQVPFIDLRTGLVDRVWYRFLEGLYLYPGTMANQDADDVVITGGTIDGTVIGATTPAAATFTTLAIASGAVIPSTYTPAFTNETNVTDSASNSDWLVMRMGNVANVSGRVSVTPTAAAGTATTLGISLPISSTFTLAGNLAGVAATLNSDVGRVAADTSNHRAMLQFASGFTSARAFSVNFTFIIQ